MPVLKSVSESVTERFNSLNLSLSTQAITDLVWNDEFSEDERQRLTRMPNDRAGRKKNRKIGAVELWSLLHGVSKIRAILDVARVTDLLSAGEYKRLLREIGEKSKNPHPHREAQDPEKTLRIAIESGHLVMRESPREVYWQKQKIKIDWEKFSADWTYFWKLCRSSKAGGSLHVSQLGEDLDPDYLVKTKSRLVGREGFPLKLDDAIKNVDRGYQKLEIPREEIHLFEVIGKTVLRELS